MDPNATLALIEDALFSGDTEEMVDHMANLAMWIERGGYEPDWSEYPSAHAAYINRYGKGYALYLSDQDVATIGFLGQRYEWSRELWPLGSDLHRLEEHEAWEIREAVEADTEGGHNPYPMLLPGSPLHRKLEDLIGAII